VGGRSGEVTDLPGDAVGVRVIGGGAQVGVVTVTVTVIGVGVGVGVVVIGGGSNRNDLIEGHLFGQLVVGDDIGRIHVTVVADGHGVGEDVAWQGLVPIDNLVLVQVRVPWRVRHGGLALVVLVLTGDAVVFAGDPSGVRDEARLVEQVLMGRMLDPNRHLV